MRLSDRDRKGGYSLTKHHLQGDCGYQLFQPACQPIIQMSDIGGCKKTDFYAFQKNIEMTA